MASDSSFWHKLDEQQTTSTVGLGFVTTDPADPSTCFWPDPGLLLPFRLRREWITHHTSIHYSSDTSSVSTDRAKLHCDGPMPGVDESHTRRRGTEDLFVSDLLITYKLKNPAQFLRDIFDVSYLEEFCSRFAGRTKLYLMTGYKVSRNVQSAIEHDKSSSNDLHFELSTTCVIPKASKILHGVVQEAAAGVENGHVYLSSIRYQAPGDSVFYVRYQPIQILFSSTLQKRVLVIPAAPQSWEILAARRLCQERSKNNYSATRCLW